MAIRPLRWAALIRGAVLTLAAALVLASAARAADPILPLAEVQPGMDCTGLSVIKGTTISSFDVEIIDVIAPEAGLSGARMLVRVGGPAVAVTGIGPGFSGSPILCGDRNAGAISEGVGEYGNHVALATPIEQILREQPVAPRTARRDRALLRSARPLTGPLTVSGVTGRTRRLLERASRRAGRVLVAAPAGPAGGYAPADLRPGAAVGAAISTGDLAIAGVGTVTYRDGDRLWAFGHALDGLGRRALLLQDSYVFSVINNPVAIPDFGVSTYKLASSAGNVQGTFTRDASAAIAGIVGAPPPTIPLRVAGRSRAGDAVTLESQLADERSLGYGAGLGLLAPLAVSQALERLTRDFGPVSFSMCARFRVRQLRRPLGFCNPYFAVDPALNDLAEGAGLVEFFDLAPLDLERAEVSISEVRGRVLRDVILGADGPRRARPGQQIRVRLTLQRRLGGRRRLDVRVRVPRGIGPGPQRLALTGNGGSLSGEEEIIHELADAIGFEVLGGCGGGFPEPRTLRQLAADVRTLRRPLGIEARFGRGSPPRLVLRSDEVSFEGSARLRLRVLDRRR